MSSTKTLDEMRAEKELAALHARREKIADELHQMVIDAEHWNRLHPNEKPIVIDLDLTKEVDAALAARKP